MMDKKDELYTDEVKEAFAEVFRPIFGGEEAKKPPVLPLGFNVLVEIIPVQVTSALGIILCSANEQERERKGRDIARIVAFGPIAYKGYSGCESPQDWGVKEGDIVELSTRYDGKYTRAHEYNEAYKNYRYVTDQDIMGLAQGDFLEMLKNQLESNDE